MRVFALIILVALGGCVGDEPPAPRWGYDYAGYDWYGYRHHGYWGYDDTSRRHMESAP